MDDGVKTIAIRPVTAKDREAMWEIINDAAQAYRVFIQRTVQKDGFVA